MQTLHNKVAIVTGASSGIGRATACELAQRGAKVVLAARRGDALTSVQQEIESRGGIAISLPTDVAEVEQVLALVQKATEVYGQIDVLVNNAGVGAGTLSQMTIEQINYVVQVNLTSAILMTHAVLPGMIQRRNGVIISVASVASVVAIGSLYSATKAGLRSFSLALRRQLQGSGVTTSVISPGFIRTPMTTHIKREMPEPDIVAQAIAKLILHPQRELVIPRRYALALWVEQQFPWLVDRAITGTINREVDEAGN